MSYKQLFSAPLTKTELARLKLFLDFGRLLLWLLFLELAEFLRDRASANWKVHSLLGVCLSHLQKEMS